MPIPFCVWVLTMLRTNLSVKSILCLLFSLVLVVCSVACKSQDTLTQNENQITFTDALGRSVLVPKNVKRTAATLGCFAEIWQLAGGEVVASADDAWQDFGLDMGDAVNIGGAHSPSLELLLSAKPDFVIASASTSADVEMQETLESAGITVAYFDIDNFDDYLEMLDVCTNITNRKDLYQQNGLKIKEQIDNIKQDFKNSNLPENQRTVLLLRAASGFVKAKGSSGTILGEMLNDIGCINIADSDSSLLENLSIENIIEQEPYHIFVVTMGDEQKAIDNLTKTMKENPAWATLEAVQQDRMHFMDKKMFNLKPNAKWAQSYEQLCEVFYESK